MNINITYICLYSSIDCSCKIDFLHKIIQKMIKYYIVVVQYFH